MSNIAPKVPILRNKLVTLDCNVFLLFVIGSIGTQHISEFKRTRMFTEDDYSKLISLVNGNTLMITPNVATEASNLLESYTYQKKKIGLIALNHCLQLISETFEPSRLLSNLDVFFQYGLSDTSISNLCKVGAIAITVDFDLYVHLMSNNYPALNFNHIIGKEFIE